MYNVQMKTLFSEENKSSSILESLEVQTSSFNYTVSRQELQGSDLKILKIVRGFKNR